MSEPNDELPPLPDNLRFAIASFRATRPSPQLEARVAEALANPEAPRPAPARRPPARARLAGGLVVAGLALAAAVAGVRSVASHFAAPPELLAVPPREIAVTLPTAGPAWVHLPWRLHDHPSPASVHLETPAHATVHQSAALAVRDARPACDGDRCVYRFVAPANHPAEPLRVQIHSPGRYEFRVTHASRSRLFQEHFVVLATR